MPDIGVFHPQVVHFVVALGFVGILLRLVSVTGFLPWTKPAATVLLLVAAGAGVVAVQSGKDAHGPAERIPGARDAVHEHEELGELTRNLFLAVAALELAALALRRREPIARGILYLSAAGGIGAGIALFEAAEHGGAVVYSYAGGVGTRSGHEDDVQRLLVAGLYHQARAARAAGRRDEAERLTQELVRQVPDDPAVALLLVESLIRDRQDPQAALAALSSLTVPDDQARLQIQKGLLASEALVAAGQLDSARATLQDLKTRFPQAERPIAEALGKLQ